MRDFKKYKLFMRVYFLNPPYSTSSIVYIIYITSESKNELDLMRVIRIGTIGFVRGKENVSICT